MPELLHQRYRLLHRLGTGGFGAVYQAEDTQLGGRPVAVREMRPQNDLNDQENADVIEAFKKEALLLAELMHPNLPRIYDHFNEGRNWYLVMDFIEGETLEEYLGKTARGYLPLSEVLDIGLQLCDVLDYLHTRQPPVIFRDLKPLNVMRTSSGHLYLIDFGIARHFKPGQMKDTIAFGSPGYAAPEQFRFAPLRLPEDRPTPKALATLLGSMLEMDELKRPASMKVVKAELQSIATRVASGSFAVVKPSTPTPVSVSSPPSPEPSPVTYGVLRCSHKALHQGVRSLAWSPTSKRLLSAGNSNVVEIWDASDGSQIYTYRNHKGSIRMALWSPDGKYVASASEDKTVQVWEASSGRMVQIYRGHSHLVTGLGWSPDSRRIASSSIDKSVQIWDIQTGDTYVNYTRHKDVVYRAAWSPDGKYVASGGYDNIVRVWEAMSGKGLMVYEGHSALIFALGWSPDSQRLASGSYDATVQVWSPFNGQLMAAYHGHTGQVQSLSWSPDGTRIVSCGSNAQVRVWDTSNGAEIFIYHGHEVQPDILPVQSGQSMYVPGNSRLYQVVEHPQVEIGAVAWSPDGAWIASGGTDNLIQVWSAP
jgi:WD40 repeat protein